MFEDSNKMVYVIIACGEVCLKDVIGRPGTPFYHRSLIVYK